MLQLQDVQNEISTVTVTMSKYPREDKMRKSAERRVAYLESIKLYLQTQPTEEYLKAEIKKLEARLQTIANGYQTWLGG